MSIIKPSTSLWGSFQTKDQQNFSSDIVFKADTEPLKKTEQAWELKVEDILPYQTELARKLTENLSLGSNAILFMQHEIPKTKEKFKESLFKTEAEQESLEIKKVKTTAPGLKIIQETEILEDGVIREVTYIDNKKIERYIKYIDGNEIEIIVNHIDSKHRIELYNFNGILASKIIINDKQKIVFSLVNKAIVKMEEFEIIKATNKNRIKRIIEFTNEGTKEISIEYIDGQDENRLESYSVNGQLSSRKKFTKSGLETETKFYGNIKEIGYYDRDTLKTVKKFKNDKEFERIEINGNEMILIEIFNEKAVKLTKFIDQEVVEVLDRSAKEEVKIVIHRKQNEKIIEKSIAEKIVERVIIVDGHPPRVEKTIKSWRAWASEKIKGVFLNALRISPSLPLLTASNLFTLSFAAAGSIFNLYEAKRGSKTDIILASLYLIPAMSKLSVIAATFVKISGTYNRGTVLGFSTIEDSKAINISCDPYYPLFKFGNLNYTLPTTNVSALTPCAWRTDPNYDFTKFNTNNTWQAVCYSIDPPKFASCYDRIYNRCGDIACESIKQVLNYSDFNSIITAFPSDCIEGSRICLKTYPFKVSSMIVSSKGLTPYIVRACPDSLNKPDTCFDAKCNDTLAFSNDINKLRIFNGSSEFCNLEQGVFKFSHVFKDKYNASVPAPEALKLDPNNTNLDLQIYRSKRFSEVCEILAKECNKTLTQAISSFYPTPWNSTSNEEINSTKVIIISTLTVVLTIVVLPLTCAGFCFIKGKLHNRSTNRQDNISETSEDSNEAGDVVIAENCCVIINRKLHNGYALTHKGSIEIVELGPLSCGNSDSNLSSTEVSSPC